MPKHATFKFSPLQMVGIILLWLVSGFIILLYTIHYLHWISDADNDPNKFYDFRLFYTGVHDFFSVGNIYKPGAIDPFSGFPISLNNNSPVGTLFIMPFASLPLKIAIISWVVSCVVLFVIGLVFLARVFPVPKNWNWRILLITFIYMCYPIGGTLQLGNWGFIIFFLDLATWYYARKNQDKLAGVFLGIAICIRWQPGLLLLFFLVKQRWKLLISTLLTALSLAGFSMIIFGFNSYIDFLQLILQNSTRSSSDAYDASLRAFLTRLFEVVGLSRDNIFLPGLWISLLIAITIFTGWKINQISYDWGFSLCLVAGLLFAPLSWFHYHSILILPLILLALHKQWWSVGYTVVLWLSINLFYPVDFSDNRLVYGFLLTLSLIFIYVNLTLVAPSLKHLEKCIDNNLERY